MSTLIHQSLKESLYQLLSEDATLSGIVSGVYGEAPESVAYPYLLIGPMQSRDWSTRTSLGFSTQIEVQAYGQAGSKQLDQVLDRIYELVVDGNLTLLNHQLVALRFEQHEVSLQPDGQTHRGHIRFRAYSEFEPV